MMMKHVYWVHIDPSRNRRRWYALYLQPTLFGEVDVVCQWGRLGYKGGQQQVTTYTDSRAAAVATMAIVERRERHGYQLRFSL